MPKNSKIYMRAYYHRKRAEVIRSLGGKCIFCGDPTIENLRIDHKNGYTDKVSPNGTRGGFRNLWDAIKIIRAGRSNELQIICYKCDHGGYKIGSWGR